METTVADSETKKKKLMPKVISFDANGVPLNQQDTEMIVDDTENPEIVLPWKPWLTSTVAPTLYTEIAHVASVSLLLHALSDVSHMSRENVVITQNVKTG